MANSEKREGNKVVETDKKTVNVNSNYTKSQRKTEDSQMTVKSVKMH